MFFHHHPDSGKPCLMFSNIFVDVVFTKPAQPILLQFEWSHEGDVIYAMVLNAFLTVDQTPKTSMLYISYVIVHCSAPTSCGHILYFSLTMLWSFNQMNFWECVLNAGKHLWKTTCYFIFEHNKAALEVKILHSWDLLSINFSELIISRLLYCTFFCLTELIRHSFVGPGFQISFQAECALSLSWSVRSLCHNFLACVVWMSDAESLFTTNSWKSIFIIQCCCTLYVSVEPIYKQFIWLMDTSHDNYVNVIGQHHHHCIIF